MGWNQCLGEGKELAMWYVLACTASLKDRKDV